MIPGEVVPLHRLFDRRDIRALLREFAGLLPGVELAVFGADGRLFTSTPGWPEEQVQLPVDGAESYSIEIAESRIAVLAVWNAALDEAPVQQGVALLRAMLLRLATEAVEKRALARETLERYREITLLYNIGETVISCLDAQALPELIMQESCSVIRVDAGAVFLVDAESGELKLRAGYQLNTENELTLQLARNVSERMVLSGHSYVDNEFQLAHEMSWVRALLGVPLKARDRVLGMIVLLRSADKGMFTAGDEKLLNALAMQTAIALENARLYGLVGRALERREDQLSTVAEISRELNETLNLERILDLVVRRCMEATGARAGAIALLEESQVSAPSGSKLQIVSPYGFKGDLPRHLRQLVEMVIQTRQTAVRAESHLLVPIQLEGQSLGAIMLTDSPRRFWAEDEVFIGQLAEHAATAIRNARLYERAEQERSRLAATVAGTREAIIVVDEQQRLVLANPAAQVFFRAATVDLVNRRLEEIASGSGLISLLKRAVVEGQVRTGEVSGPGETTFYGGASPLPGIGWVIVLQDISYLKQLDALRSEFVAAASHDLKNPISIIMGYTTLISASGGLNEVQRQSLDAIVKAAQSMTSLINDLLDIVKIEAGFLGQMVPCQPAGIVKDVVSQLRHQARAKRVNLSDKVARNLPQVLGNPHRLEQVVANLVSNAIKYTPEGGRINVLARQDDGEVVIAVEDTGIGIPTEEIPRLFERFYRARAARDSGVEGTGLGLYICKSIVEKHGGRIWAESGKGQGSTFFVTLPVMR